MNDISEANRKIIVGLDVQSAKRAHELVRQLPECSIFKIGPHFRHDPRACSELLDYDFRDGASDVARENPLWFGDDKLFDIETTVEAAVHNLAYRVNELSGTRQFVFVTVHAHEPVMKAAVKAAAGTQLKVLAVPLMTSFSRGDINRFFGVDYDTTEFMIERTRRAVDCGCAGSICAATEVGTLRGNVVPRDFLLVVPGTRPDKVALHDHKRSGSPFQAIRDGADHLVLSRPIIHTENPSVSFRQIAEEIRSALLAH